MNLFLSTKCFLLTSIFSEDCKTVIQSLNDDDDGEMKVIESCVYETCQMIEEKKGLKEFYREYLLLMSSFRKSFNTKQRLSSKVRVQAVVQAANESKLRSFEDILRSKPQLRKEIMANLLDITKKLQVKQDEEAKLLSEKERLEQYIANLKESGNELEKKNCGPTAYFKLLHKLEILRETHKTTIEEHRKIKEQLDRVKNNLAETNTELENIQTEKMDVLESIHSTVAHTNEQTKIKNNMVNEVESKKSFRDKLISQDEKYKEMIKQEKLDIDNIYERNQSILAFQEELNIKKLRLQNKFSESEEDLKLLQSKFQCFRHSVDTKKIENSVMQEEIKFFKVDIGTVTKIKETLNKKIAVLLEKRLEVDIERTNVISEKSKLEDEMARFKALHETERKEMESIKKAYEAMCNDLHMTSYAAAKRDVFIETCFKSQKNCRTLISEYETQIELLSDEVRFVASEIGLCNEEIRGTGDRISEKESEIHCRNIELMKLYEQESSLEKKLKLQLNLCELMKKDSSNINCFLSERQEELSDLKLNHKLYQTQTGQLKNEISFKNQTMNKIIEETNYVRKELSELCNNIEHCNEDIEKNHLYLEAQSAEEYKLMQIVLEADLEYQRKKKSVSKLFSDRDIIKWQLWSSSEETDSLMEIMSSQCFLIKRNEREYNMTMKKRNNIVADVYLNVRLSEEYKRCIRDLPLLERLCKNLDAIIFQQKVLKTALLEESCRPINIHRWRRLKTNFYKDWRNMNYLPRETADDPYVYETLTRIHSITKRLIKRTSDLTVCQKKTEEMHKVYSDCKAIYARHPGLELCDQVHRYKALLKAKRNEYKVMKEGFASQEEEIVLSRGRAKYLKDQLDRLVSQYYNRKRAELREVMIRKSNLNCMLRSKTFRKTDSMDNVERTASTNLPQLRGISIRRSSINLF